MALDLMNIRDRLLKKYNVSGLIGPDMDEIPCSAEDLRGFSLNNYVVGDILRSALRSPEFAERLVKEMPDVGQDSSKLKLTSEGVNYFRKNVNNMVEEYNSFFGDGFNEGVEKDPLGYDVDSPCVRNGIRLESILGSGKNLVLENGSASIVNGEPRKSKLLSQNAYSSTSFNLAEDLVDVNCSDEWIVGSRNATVGARNVLYDKR